MTEDATQQTPPQTAEDYARERAAKRRVITDIDEIDASKLPSFEKLESAQHKDCFVHTSTGVFLRIEPLTHDQIFMLSGTTDVLSAIRENKDDSKQDKEQTMQEISKFLSSENVNQIVMLSVTGALVSSLDETGKAVARVESIRYVDKPPSECGDREWSMRRLSWADKWSVLEAVFELIAPPEAGEYYDTFQGESQDTAGQNGNGGTVPPLQTSAPPIGDPQPQSNQSESEIGN